MSPATAAREHLDRRVLGGFFFSDAITAASVSAPLTVASTQLKLRVNRSGVYAIFDAPGFSGLNTEFIPGPDWPTAPGPSFEISVQAPNQRYLPRRAKISAPRTLASLGTAQQVTLYPDPSSYVAPNWAVIRATVAGNNGVGLPWAVLQAIRSDKSVAATGMTDARGEALLALTGIGVQVSTNSTGAVTETTIPLTVQAWFDPSALNQPSTWIPDPDDILNNLANASLKTNTLAASVGPGQTFFAAITISV